VKTKNKRIKELNKIIKLAKKLKNLIENSYIFNNSYFSKFYYLPNLITFLKITKKSLEETTK